MNSEKSESSSSSSYLPPPPRQQQQQQQQSPGGSGNNNNNVADLESAVRGMVSSSSSSSGSTAADAVGAATPRQVDEMIGLLRTLSSSNGGGGAAQAQQLQQLQHLQVGAMAPASASVGGGGGFSKKADDGALSHGGGGMGTPLMPPSVQLAARRYYTTFSNSTPRMKALIAICAFFTLVLLLNIVGSIFNNDPYSASSSNGTGGIGSGVMQNFVISTSTLGNKDKVMYYNTPGVPNVVTVAQKAEEQGKDMPNVKPLPLSSSLYPDGGAVIVTLVTASEQDVNNLQIALRSLVFLGGDRDATNSKSSSGGVGGGLGLGKRTTTRRGQRRPLTPVLVFNEGDLSEAQRLAIASSTDRPVGFPMVDFTEFPPGFDPNVVDSAPHFDVKDRKPWGYYQMIRFWVTTLWAHPAINRFEIVMRIDSDSCFKAPNSYLPYMKHDHLNYHSQYVGVEPEAGRQYLNGLYDYTVEYMKRVNKSPGNMMLWHFIETTWKAQGTLPILRTNMEISRKSFMTREDVVLWHNALTEQEPFGLLRYRWGDAVTRFLEAAIFATDAETLTIHPEGYEHKTGCTWPEVEEALKTYGHM